MVTFVPRRTAMSLYSGNKRSIWSKPSERCGWSPPDLNGGEESLANGRGFHIEKTAARRLPMANAKTKKIPTLITSAPHKNIEERIRSRAYELYQARGREDGRDWEDWLRAESEIKGKSAKAASA
jgi:hypothetical protein